LANNNIKGTISSSILHCRRLVHLNVTNNQLSGRLPKSLRRLKYLKNLDVSNNDISTNYMAQISKLESISDLDTIQPTTSSLTSNNTSKNQRHHGMPILKSC
jgi:Leucine-rich repeat (LRR) protein